MDQSKTPREPQQGIATQEKTISAIELLKQQFFSSLSIVDLAIEDAVRKIAKDHASGITAADYEIDEIRDEVFRPIIEKRIESLYGQVPALIALYWIDAPRENADQEEEAFSNLRAFVYRVLEGQLNSVKEWDSITSTITGKKGKEYDKLIGFIEYALEHRDGYTNDAIAQAEGKSNYAGLFSSQVSALLQTTSTRTNKPQLRNDGTGIAELRNGPLTIEFKDYDMFTSELKVSTRKVLDACVLRLTAQNSRDRGKRGIFTEVMIPLKTYMEMCGIPDTDASRKKTRTAVDKDLKSLAKMTIDCKEVGKGRKKRPVHANICDIGFIDNYDNIIYKFAPTFAEHLVKSYMMQFPLALFKVSERNPSTFNIGRKLALHNSMDSNITRGTANIISVKTLLDVCPDIPSAEQVAATDRHYQTRIVNPFEKALDKLVKDKVLASWEYCNAKSAPLTGEQYANMGDYGTFTRFYVKFSMRDAPDQSARIERNAKKREKLEKQKELRTLKKLDALKKETAEQAEADISPADESDQPTDK